MKPLIIRMILLTGLLANTPLIPFSSRLCADTRNYSPSLLEMKLSGTVGQKRIEILMQIISAYQFREPNKVVRYGREALEMLQYSPDPEKELAVLKHLGSACIQTGDLSAARDYGVVALKLARNSGDKIASAEANIIIGHAYWPRGNFARALELFREARDIFIEKEYEPGLANAINAIGTVYWRLGDYTKALEFLLEACQLFEKNGEIITTGESYNNIGQIYWDLQNYPKALEYFQKSLDLYKQSDMKAGIARVLKDIGHFHESRKNYANALNYYQQAFESSRSLGMRILTAVVLSSIGAIYENNMDYPLALRYYFEALELNKNLNNSQAIPGAHLNIARIYRKMHRIMTAQQHLNWAREAAGKFKAKEELREIHQELAAIHTENDNFTEALQQFKSYKDISDTIFNETNNRLIAEIQTRDEITRRETKIELLKKNENIIQLELGRQRDLKNGLIIIATLMIATAFVFFTLYRVKTRLSKALQKEIEEHKTTTRKLRESEEKFRALAEQSVVGIYILMDNRLQYVNPSMALTFGYTLAEMSVMTPPDLAHPEDKSMVTEKINRSLNGESDIIQYEFRGQTRDGDTIYLQSLICHFLFQGKPAVLGSMVDITEHKQSESELLRTRKLEAIGILAGGIAHDFNNLLAVIMGYIFMVGDDPTIKSSPLISHELNSAELAAVQASDLVRNFIAISENNEPYAFSNNAQPFMISPRNQT